MTEQIITLQNVGTIIGQVKKSGGYIIIPIAYLDSCEINLYGNSVPDLRNDGEIFIEGSEHPHDRKYKLRHIILSNDARHETTYGLFKRLEFGDYHFEIDYPSCMIFPLDGETDLYLGQVSLDTLIAILRKQFEIAAREIGADVIRKGEIEQIVEYALHDLKTAEILTHNLAALEKADFVAGYNRPFQSMS